MRTIRSGLAVAMLGWVVGVASRPAGAEEKKIAIGEVPKAVMNSVKAKFPGAKITGAEKEEEDGKVMFEVSLTHDGQSFEVGAKPDGTIVEVEKEIEIKDLPTAVSKAVAAKYPDATIKEAEEVRKGDALSYEVVIKDGGKTRELTLNPHGKILETEDGDDEKEKD